MIDAVTGKRVFGDLPDRGRTTTGSVSCLVGNGLWYVSRGSLFRLDLDTLVSAPVPFPRHKVPAPTTQGGEQSLLLSGLCGSRGSNAILAVVYGYGLVNSAVLAFDATNALVWEVDLGLTFAYNFGRSLFNRWAFSGAIEWSFSGDLTRFVLVHLRTPTRPGAQKDSLAMIDTDLGRIDLGRIKASEILHGPHAYGVLARRGRYILFGGSDRVVAFDGERGVIAAAIHMSKHEVALSANLDDETFWIKHRPGVVMHMSTLDAWGVLKVAIVNGSPL